MGKKTVFLRESHFSQGKKGAEPPISQLIAYHSFVYIL